MTITRPGRAEDTMTAPPQHSATATIQVIVQTDNAWNLDRFVAEVNEMPESAAGDHPLALYFSGKTRYDLDAPGRVGETTCTPRDYLLPSTTPALWTLRRLRIGEASRCRDIGGRQAQLEAFALAVTSSTAVEVPPQGITRRLSDREVESIADQVGARVVWEVGEAAMRASEAPTSAEKKP